MSKYKRILVPVDFSNCSRAALDLAALIAEANEATIEVLHVWAQPPLKDARVAVHHAGDVSGTLHQLGVAAEKEMAAFLECAEHARVSVGRVESGDPTRRILALAAEGYDLIVLGTHGRTGLSHLLLGSVAEKVSRGAPCPVVTVRLAREEPAAARKAQ